MCCIDLIATLRLRKTGKREDGGVLGKARAGKEMNRNIQTSTFTTIPFRNRASEKDLGESGRRTGQLMQSYVSKEFWGELFAN